MKNRILTFIIGLLVGAILATLGFFIYAKTMNVDDRQMPPMMMEQKEGERGPRGERPEMPSNPDNMMPEDDVKGE